MGGSYVGIWQCGWLLRVGVAGATCTTGSNVDFNSGNVDLPRILPFLGRTQLQVLSVVVSFLLLAGHLVMAVFVKERVLSKDSSTVGCVVFLAF